MRSRKKTDLLQWNLSHLLLLLFFQEHRCRSSTIDLQNPQCPICQLSFNGQEMITHVQHELDAIQRRQSSKMKRENKVTYFFTFFFFFEQSFVSSQVLIDNNNNNIDQTFKTRYEVR